MKPTSHRRKSQRGVTLIEMLVVVVIMGLFVAGYGVVRISLENVREPDAYMPHFPLGLTMGMMLSAPMVLIGLVLIWRGLREPLPPALEIEEAHLAPQAKRADEPA